MRNRSKKLKCLWRSITVCVILVIALAGCATNKNRVPIISVVDNNNSSAQVNASTKVKRYRKIQKGSYSGMTYHIKSSDTLFYIAWVTGIDYRYLARRNNIIKPYILSLGQILLVGNVTRKPSETSILANNNVMTDLIPKKNSSSEPVAVIAAIDGWLWPTDGKIIDKFSSDERGNKGVDISGDRGQPILSTASGRVVYAGNDLRGYGNLIIIKHNNNYLSAYAHNDKLLVQEQQEVKAGQKISTMGSTGTTTTKLHFAIHFQGKAVNPLRYLPQS